MFFEFYYFIVRSEIKILYDGGIGVFELIYSWWVDLMCCFIIMIFYIICDLWFFFDYDMFVIIFGLIIVVIFVVFDYVDDEEVCK